MDALFIALLAGIGFLLAYHTYGKWLGRKIFRLSASTVCPSAKLADGRDYVPTRREVVFGHHFTSIAGTGPIVGPAIAIMWGWLPALLWVLFGSIFIGAVHDFGSLVVSLRNNGQSVGDVAGRLLNHRVRLLFLLILFLCLMIVIAIFGLVIAAVFKQFPAAIFPCLVQVPLAIAIGTWMHRHNIRLLAPSVVALVIMYLTVIYGDVGFLGTFNEWMASWPTWLWVTVLLVYAFFASILPVGTLLQPRDYINSLQLISALGLVVIGLVVAAVVGGAPNVDGGERPALSLSAPMVQWDPAGAPMIFPFLFITIACGAISGFHCLVSSGTSSKQLTSESDARFVGYGAMLTEGFLATLVILACAAGLGLGVAAADGGVLTGREAWESRYGSWAAADGLAAKVGAFVDGSANFLGAIGIPGAIAVALMGVFVASFAATTLDTACRLQRYVVQELAGGFNTAMNLRGGAWNPVGWMGNRLGATAIAVVTGGALAALPAPGAPWTLETAGSGGLILWPLFGASNQLLAGLAFLVVAFYLWRRRLPVFFVIPPLLFMLVIPMWAMVYQTFIGAPDNPSWLSDGNWLLVAIGTATMLLQIWMVAEAVRLYPRTRGVLELNAADVAPAGK